MLKKKFILINLSTKNNLYLSIIISRIDEYKKLMTPIFLRNNAFFFNLQSNLC